MQGTCASKSFKALLGAQFISAFNDNTFKIIVSLLAIKMLPTADAAAQFVSLVGLIFMLPFVIFSPYAGMLADRFPKRTILVSTLAVKVFNMILALIALVSGNLWFLCFVLFLLVVESAFFSPAKYGILPEILNEQELSQGNGFIQMWTFIAIISGTAFGGKLLELSGDRIYWAGVVMIILAVIGFLASLSIKAQAMPQARRNFQTNLFVEIISALKEIRKDRGLFLTMLALGFFSFLGAAFQMNILIYGSHILKLPQTHTSFLLAAVLSGIASGGVIAGWFSEKKIEFGLVPLGSLGICVFCLLLGLVPGDFVGALVCLFFLGMSAGFYTVPLNAFYQRYSPGEKRGQYLAALNIVSSLSVLLASGFLWLLSGKLGVSSAGIFMILGFVTIAVTIYIVRVLPEALVRLINWLIAHSIYNLRPAGLEHVPEKGGALIVSNHISFVDAILILACLKRPVRFIMHQQMFDLPVVSWFCRALKVIPIDPKIGPKAMLSSLITASDAVKQGELVCIFPEGHLSRTGNMLPFQKGLERIMKDLDAPIIPLYLDNIWGSIFSFADGKYFWKMPRQTRYPVSLVFGKPLPASTKAFEVRLAVQELGAQANMMRGIFRQKLHLSFLCEVKKHAFCFCMADSSGLKLKYFEVLSGALALSRAVFPSNRQPRETNEMVGVLLPSSCAAAMANLAVAYAGKVPVNLNFTLSAPAFDSCVKQCQMKTIITSRAFIEKIAMPPSEQMIFLEDVFKSITQMRKMFLALCVLVLPRFVLQSVFVKGDKKNVDDVATVIFSSGSTGEPKGVMLTHGNIFSNIESFYQVFDMKHSDIVMAALPFFHSFGFTATLCFPIGTGIGVVYHNNPMDAATIGKLTEKYSASILMGTPTFMSGYLRKCTAKQFASVRMAVVGAEKLKESLALAFQEKFNVMPFEGYGATELSPIVTVGFPGYYNEQTKNHQIGHKMGKVGHPIPGVAVKVVDPDTFQTLGCDQAGLLLVKGANVMKGYLNNPSKTMEVIKDGWYVTGDIATIDQDGFVMITDRLSRFSKIGGEMVPHIKIEENIMEILGAVDPLVAVASVADDKKGERLVVLHAVDLDVANVCEGLVKKGLPNLWIPKKENFYRIDAIPLLGTGKVDLKSIKTMAQKLVVEQAQTEE